jgi:hypothetical protein
MSYSVHEYQAFVREFLSDGTAVRMSGGRLKKPPPRWMYPFLMALARVIFFFKKRRMPVCDFTIDENGIRRVTKDGTLVTPWKDVKAVHRYSEGYFIEKAKGAMPLPYRCFTPETRAAMDALITSKASQPRS